MNSMANKKSFPFFHSTFCPLSIFSDRYSVKFYWGVYLFVCLQYFWDKSLALLPGWYAVVWSPLIASSTSLAQMFLPSPPPKYLRTTGTCHSIHLIFFFFFCRHRVLPCCPCWSWIPDHKWCSHLGLRKCFYYRHKPPWSVKLLF